MSISLKVTLADENRNLLSFRTRNRIDILDGATQRKQLHQNVLMSLVILIPFKAFVIVLKQ